MIRFPSCKINLGLHIVRKRTDGYHDLETVFYPLPLTDILEIIRRPGLNEPAWQASGLPVPGDASDNICLKAWRLLKKDFPGLPACYLHLHKIIPMGAGLGGGSSDGAMALAMLNEIGNLTLSREQLSSYALQLGSDCPFFLLNKPCYATGRGEILEEIPLDLSGYSWLLVNPGIHVSTAEAFAEISPAPAPRSPKEIVKRPLQEWKDELRNDFEAPVAGRHPEITAIKDAMYAAGALYASMTGSGSTVYGIFEKGRAPSPAGFPPGYTVHAISP